MLKTKVTLRGLVISDFMYHLKIGRDVYTCLCLVRGLNKLGYNQQGSRAIITRYEDVLRDKYPNNFIYSIYHTPPPPKERLQNLLDFIKSKGL